MTPITQPGWQSASFATLLTFALMLYNQLFPDAKPKIRDSDEILPEYDFVVIGGGSAGAVVANRLTEIEDWKVLLLEAGGQESLVTDIPLMAQLSLDTELDWKYRTEPPIGDQHYCLSMVNNSCKWPAGKVVGGTSVINYMLYARGNRRDYDYWEYLGNTGWGYASTLKYFKKSEDNANEDLLDTPYHASGGYLTVEDEPWTSRLANVFVRAGVALGYENRDVNGEEQVGFTIPQGTVRSGSRCSTSKAFIVPVQSRSNLDVSIFSHATRIGFETANSKIKATTVDFIKNSTQFSVRVRKEIILSAGTMASPQILMLSGVGPARHLKDMNIKVVKDLNVGHNLQDHLGVALTYKMDPPLTVSIPELKTPESLAEYLLAGKGPLTSFGGVEGLGFINTKFAPSSGLYPDIEFHFLPLSMYTGKRKPFGYAMYNLRPDLFNKTRFEQLEQNNLFTIIPVLLRPKSRGRISLRSKDPFDLPIIEPNYMTRKEDRDVLVEGMKEALRLVTTQPFRELNAVPLDIHFPGCENYKLYSDDYLECVIRHFTVSFNHPTSTCPMGISSAAGAVVDPRLRVHGIDGLRIMDASIMPLIVSGNTNAPTIMIGEKGSDLIKEDWIKGYCDDPSAECANNREQVSFIPLKKICENCIVGSKSKDSTGII